MYTPLNLILILFLLFSSGLEDPSEGKAYPRDYFSSPVAFKIYLAANFGEIRSDHFHSGIDIKTNSRSGEDILSVADGFISRISVSPGGFGKALYIQHPNGYTSVYGHLSKFTSKIEAFVKSKQYENQSFTQNLFPKSEQFPVKQGELIAYSGNTGSSNGPHLHFEIRETDNQHPYNPLLFGLPIEDNISPIVRSISIYPDLLNSGTSVKTEKTEYPVGGRYGKYALKGNKIINVPSRFGIGIESYDLLNGYPNRCGVYSIELRVDGTRQSYIRINEFAFSETRYINSHIDYNERSRYRRNIQKTFTEPNNQSRIYETLINKGIIELDDPGEHTVDLILQDVYQNSSTLSFLVRYDPLLDQQLVSNQEKDFLMVLPYNSKSQYKMNGFEMLVPSNALYDSLYFRLAVTPRIYPALSKTYHIHDPSVPLHKFITLRIKPDTLLPRLHDKMLLGGWDDKGMLFARGGEWKNGLVELQTRDFGKYMVILDTIPPSIRPNNFRSNQDLSNWNFMRFTIKDDLSGIAGYEGYIDGEWALIEYDPKNERLHYTFDADRIGRYKQHELKLIVRDQKGNESELFMNFRW